MLAPLVAVGLLSRGQNDQAGGRTYLLTERGFDRYHDLERWVTYQLIEPLWTQMLAEHDLEGASADWVDPAAGRRTRLWQGVSALLERRPRAAA